MLATYWTTWSGPVPISGIPDYNTVMLALATPGDTAGSVAFEQNREPRVTFMSDIQSVRSNGHAQKYPSLRGVFSWDASCDRNSNYRFAANMTGVHA
jgi:hypothetical protein